MRSSICQCLSGDTNVDAAMAPEAATAGRPMPGNVQSPQQRRPSMGVFCQGNCPSPARIPGPYVPACLRTKCACVKGVPTCRQCSNLDMPQPPSHWPVCTMTVWTGLIDGGSRVSLSIALGAKTHHHRVTNAALTNVRNDFLHRFPQNLQMGATEIDITHACQRSHSRTRSSPNAVSVSRLGCKNSWQAQDGPANCKHR